MVLDQEAGGRCGVVAVTPTAPMTAGGRLGTSAGTPVAVPRHIAILWAAHVQGLVPIPQGGGRVAALSFDLCGGRSGGITRVVQEVAWQPAQTSERLVSRGTGCPHVTPPICGHTQQVSDFEGEGYHVQKLRSVVGVRPLHCELGHGAIAVVKALAEAGAASHWLVTTKVKGKPGAPRKHRLVVSKPLPQDLPKRCAPTYSDDDHRGTGNEPKRNSPKLKINVRPTLRLRATSDQAKPNMTVFTARCSRALSKSFCGIVLSSFATIIHQHGLSRMDLCT